MQLTPRHATPVELETTLEKPGVYSLYVTHSPYWTGSGHCAESTISAMRVDLPGEAVQDSQLRQGEQLRRQVLLSAFELEMLAIRASDIAGTAWRYRCCCCCCCC